MWHINYQAFLSDILLNDIFCQVAFFRLTCCRLEFRVHTVALKNLASSGETRKRSKSGGLARGHVQRVLHLIFLQTRWLNWIGTEGRHASGILITQFSETCLKQSSAEKRRDKP
jgi:hypothetical protein